MHNPLIADTDPKFLALRPDVRALARDAEVEYHAGMGEMGEVLPPHWDTIVDRLPGLMIRGLLPAFQMVNRLREEDAKRERALYN